MATTVKKLLAVLAFIGIGIITADAAVFPVTQADPIVYTPATASWSLGATTISIPTGLSGIAAGQAVFDNNQSANGVAATVAIVSAYNSGTGALTISAAKVASATSTDSLGIGVPQGPGCSTAFYRNAFCKSVNVSGTYRPVGPGARQDGTYYISDAGQGIPGPPTATALWSVGSTTISTQAGLPITANMQVKYNNLFVGYVASYAGTTITLQNGAYTAGPNGGYLNIDSLAQSQYVQIPAGNSPDPDPLDPTIATKAQFETKWCGGVSPCSNANMQLFLESEKKLTSAQVSRIFYVQQGGTATPGSACENSPSTPCGSIAPVFTVLGDNLGGVVIVRGANWTGGTFNAYGIGTSLIVVSSVNPDYFIQLGQPITGTGISSTVTAQQDGNPGFVSGGQSTNSPGNGRYTVGTSQNIGSTVSTAATATFSTASPTITIATGLTIAANAYVYDPIALGSNGVVGTTVGVVSSYVSGTGALTLTANAFWPSTGATDPLIIGTPEVVTIGDPPGLDFNPCGYSNGNPCKSITGQASKPLYVMAYPGESVDSDIHQYTNGYGPSPYQSSITVDSLNSRISGVIGGGGSSANNWDFEDATDIKLVNDEFIGGDKVAFGNDMNNVTVENSVLHETGAHAYYFLDDSLIGTPNFNFPANALTCKRGAVQYGPGNVPGQMCASSYAYLIDNSIYSTGATGYDAFHVNTYIKNVVIEGNTMAYGGGAAISLQTGPQNLTIKDNLFFAGAVNPLTLYIYGSVCNQPGSILNVDVENNISWGGLTTDVIRGSQPGGYFNALNGSGTERVTPCPGTTMANYKFLNNILTVDNSSGSTTVHFLFDYGSNPSTAQILNNDLWSNNASPNSATDLVGIIVAGADSMPTTLCTGSISFAGTTAKTCTLSQFQSLNSGKFASGNTYVNPLFTHAVTGSPTNISAFNFLLQHSSPACSVQGPSWTWAGC